MAIDTMINFGDAEVDTTGYNSSATTVTLASGHGARWAALTTPYNVTWWDYTTYPNPSDDPNREIVTVTNRSTDTLTVTRGAESITATTKNTVGKTYRMLPTLTAKTMTEIGTFFSGWDSANDFLTIGDANALGVDASNLHLGKTFTLPTGTAPPTPTENVQRIYFDTYQAGAVGQGRVGLSVAAYDAAAAVNKTITGAANNGSGLIRITATGHGFTSNDRINIYGVTGTTEANGVWDITVINANTFDLLTSAFSNAYVSGGTATNRSAMYGMSVTLNPTLNRIGTTGTGANGDDVNGLTIHNIGTGKSTEAIYVANSHNITGPGWYGVFSSPANADYGLLLSGEYPATSSNTGLAAACAALWPTYTNNDTNVETLRVVSVKPTFNTGGTNASKTHILVDVDSTNTAVTGVTAHLARFSYNGTQRLNLASTGNTRITGSDAAATFTDNAGTSRSANFATDNLVTSLSATLQSNAFLTHIDWSADPGTRVINGMLSHVTTASDSIAQASATYRAMNFIAQHNGSGALSTLVGANGQVTNASTGTVAQATAVGAVLQNTNASGTITTAYGVRVNDLSNSGTITNTFGLHIGDMSAGTQTNTPLSILATDANAPSALNHSLSIGASAVPAVRGTTEGTNQLKIFNGTAPVGTLTNGASFYAVSGEIRAKDSNGVEARPMRPNGRGHARCQGYAFP